MTYDNTADVHVDLARVLADEPSVHRVAAFTDGTIDVLLNDQVRQDRTHAERIRDLLGQHGYRSTVTTVLGRDSTLFEVRLVWPYRLT